MDCNLIEESENISIEERIVNRINSHRIFKRYLYRDGKLLDFIGSIENITEDLRFVLDKLNVSIDIPPKTNEPHKKISKKKSIKNSVQK